jgi:lipopolysaccharide/colanic/teichoic acid biosynthesis glycosyltransferase
MIRRAIDIAASAVALTVLSPFLAAIGWAIRRDSTGPILFRQVRIGRGGRPFEILKFRTMTESASRAPLVMGGRQDSRVTRVGRFLRRTKFDELPQLVNILRGDMTLIGPRAEVPEFVAHYSEAQRQLLRVRPGLTGPGQLEYPTRFEHLLDGVEDPNAAYLSILPDKLDTDLNYLRDRSLLLDVKVLGRTAGMLIRSLRRR